MTEFINITSVQNDLIKYAVKLQNPKFRKSEKMIFADGEKTISGFINDNIELEYLFIKKENDIYKGANAKYVVFVTDEILKKISSVKTPSSVAAILKEPDISDSIFYNLNKIALFENIKDAGNLGTILRSAAAFSIDGIILFGDCVDLYNTKVIRSTAQNIFKLPILRTSDLSFIEKLKENHKLYATIVDSAKDFSKCKFEDKFIIAFGSEASGLTEQLRHLGDEAVKLAMDNNVESLNLAVCASIVFALIKLN